MTIRVATINGIEAETAARNRILQIRAITRKEFDRNDGYRFVKGEIKGFSNNDAKNKEIIYNNNRRLVFIIPNTIWGDPIISIGDKAFLNIFKIPNYDLPGYDYSRIDIVTIPNSVRTIGKQAFLAYRNEFADTIMFLAPMQITIGANVVMVDNGYDNGKPYNDGNNLWLGSFSENFINFYKKNGMKAGTYTLGFLHWTYSP